MRCEYCDVEVTTYPDNGICIHCGAKLPPKPAAPAAPPAPEVRTVYIPVPQQVNAPEPSYAPRKTCCPKCGSTNLETVNRGFSWGWALFGFFLIPFWGLLLGFIGMRKTRLRCRSCSKKWKSA